MAPRLTSEEIRERTLARESAKAEAHVKQTRGIEAARRRSAKYRSGLPKQFTPDNPARIARQQATAQERDRLRVNRQAAAQADSYARAASREQSQRARAAARASETSGRRRTSAALDYGDSLSPGTGSFSPIGGTSTAERVSSGGASVGKSIMLVVALVGGLAIMYLLVSNGGTGGTTIFGKLGSFLSAFTSNQSLFTEKAPKPTDTSSNSQQSADTSKSTPNAQLAVATGVNHNPIAPII